MPNRVYQIIYTSKTEVDLSDEHLSAILLQAQKNNLANGLTGILLYENKEFLQVLEGSQDAVKGAWARITNDQRHAGVLLLYDGFAAHRSFAKWEMGFARLDTSKYSNMEQLNGFFDEHHQFSNLKSGLIRVFVTGFLLGRNASQTMHVAS